MEAGYSNSLEINFIGKIVPDTSIQPYGPDLGSFSILQGRICSGSSAPVLADMVRPACGSDLANTWVRWTCLVLATIVRLISELDCFQRDPTWEALTWMCKQDLFSISGYSIININSINSFSD